MDQMQTRLSRNEQTRLVQALKIAIVKCQKKGMDGAQWRDMLYDANLGLEPEDLWRWRNLLKAIVGYDPIAKVDTNPQGEKQPDAKGTTARRPPSPTLARAGKVADRTPAMQEHGESDRPVVPTKPPNNVGQPAAEAVEGRGLAKENVGRQNTLRTQSRESVPSALDRVRQAGCLSNAWPPSSKAGAGCTNSASPDLCGGPPARAVPTATKGNEGISSSVSSLGVPRSRM